MDIDSSIELFRLMVEGARDIAIFALDKEGHITTWNAGATAMTGYDAADAIGRHVSILYEQEAREHGLPAQQLEAARVRGLFQAARVSGRNRRPDLAQQFRGVLGEQTRKLLEKLRIAADPIDNCVRIKHLGIGRDVHEH